jgi:hypothetical protein
MGVVSHPGHRCPLLVSLRVLEDGMTIRGLMTQTVGVGLLLMSGCQATRNMGDDFSRVMSSQPTSAQIRNNAAVTPATRSRNTASASPAVTTASTAATTASTQESSTQASASAEVRPSAPPARTSPDGPAVALAGKSENELRALLGAPTSEEERPPGKRWRYRDGQCTLDVQLYPDVQTKQFGTLAYEVKSDDNTDEGKRLCLAQLQSRVQARR